MALGGILAITDRRYRTVRMRASQKVAPTADPATASGS
jgi:hypothetical protein